MKTQLVETRGHQGREEDDEGTADSRPGGYGHPWSHSTFHTYETIGTTCRDFGIEDCKCCGLVGTVVRRNRKETRLIALCDSYVGPVDNGNGNDHSKCNGNCNHTVTGYPPISKRKPASCYKASASFSDASILLCDQLKQEFPQVHVSRRSSIHEYTIPIDVDIDVQLKTRDHWR